MDFAGTSGRRIAGGDDLARALLDAGDPLSFDELMDATGGRSPGEVAAWLGHAIEEGLLWRSEPQAGHEVRFSLRARGRRLFAAGRRAEERHRTP
jgi:hypothetical protein